MRCIYFIVLRQLLLGLLVLTCWIGSADMSKAQSALRSETQTRLLVKVHLSLGKTTLAKALETLSTQTGLTLDAANGLSERILLAEMDNLSAAEALDALAACNDLTWSETTPGHIRLRRPLPHNPTTPEEIHKFIVAALPKDIRDFLYLGKSNAEVKRFKLPADPQFGPGSGLAQVLVPPSAAAGSQLKLQTLTSLIAAGFSVMLEPKPTPGAFYAYKDLKLETREQLLLYMLLFTLKGTDSNVLYNQFTPFQRDINKVTVELHGNALQVGSHTIQGADEVIQGFGTPVKGLAAEEAAKP